MHLCLLACPPACLPDACSSVCLMFLLSDLSVVGFFNHWHRQSRFDKISINQILAFHHFLINTCNKLLIVDINISILTEQRYFDEESEKGGEGECWQKCWRNFDGGLFFLRRRCLCVVVPSFGLEGDFSAEKK
ncbi:conserved hypothetical protein [Trichinella spiralis]|uniref:hypothetical protein n=1 Tax=Trichinella spiralis TaxID=6334 RepID=UPI0001EFCBCF|nr:conserved hypothetical protein [Trichinella spiralis]